MTTLSHLYAIAIGSNRSHGRHGRPIGVVCAALDELDRRYDTFATSPIMLNPAHGQAGRDFANVVALIATDSPPDALLAELQTVEQQFGRRPGRRWGARVLDLDIVSWSGGTYRSRSLTIPHPRLEQRTFVLQPLLTIAPDLRLRGPLTTRHLTHRLARRSPRR